MSNLNPTRDAQDLAGIEARYADVRAAYNSLGALDAVTPDMLVPYNAYLREYHRYILELSAFNQRMLDGNRQAQDDMRQEMEEIRRAQLQTQQNISTVLGWRAEAEAEAILQAADPETACPTCGTPYDNDDDGDRRDW